MSKEGDLTKLKHYFLLLLPLILLLTTAFVFFFFSKLFNNDLGYVIGFFFYYFVWCYGAPFILLGKEEFITLFKEKSPLFSKENWYLIILFFLVLFGALSMYLIPSISDASLILVLLTIPIAFIHGLGEETLWRGLYVRSFPKSVLFGVIYPTIGFAVWHLSPQIIYPAKEGIGIFLISTFFLGLSYALISYKTGSIKWVALLHTIGSLLALGKPITTSLIAVIVS